MILKAVVDTNVLVSGLFFSGPPHRILKAWDDGQFCIAISEAIIHEYKRVIEALSRKLGDINLEPILERIVIEAEMVADYAFDRSVKTPTMINSWPVRCSLRVIIWSAAINTCSSSKPFWTRPSSPRVNSSPGFTNSLTAPFRQNNPLV